jgi:tetratricopeptide (TPR) repeat protein
MQYVEGPTLAERIRTSPLSSSDVVDIGIQAALALEEAHGAGIIHRDIKPQNIIITPRGRLKVLDFGLAMLASQDAAAAPTLERLTLTGTVVGTPGFMSPEQLLGKPIDARSDIFSLGVTLYECATGRSAFDTGTPIEVAMRVVTETPPPPSALNPAVPVALDAIIARAMAKDPAERYESARSLRTDLLGLQQGVEPAVRAVSTTTSLVGARSGIVPFKAMIAAGAVIALLAAWFATESLRRGPHVPPPEAVVWYDRGTTAMREGAYFQASKALERAIAIDKDFALARARQAEAYTELELTDRAREELLHALALLPDRSNLSEVESASVDAVAATLSRSFKTAIEKYSQIANSVSDSDRPAALVDLGRAYEKDENLDGALDAYGRATKLDPQLGAGFLRAGIVQGRRQQLAAANDAFARAQDIYQAMSNQEGLAEVYYQRGSMLARIRKLPEAREQLERSRDLSRSAANEYQSIRSALQLSNVYYAEGDTALARTTAAEAVDAAQRIDIETLASNGLIDLGYTLLARGEFAETRSHLQRALDFARQERSTRLEARARLALGSLSTQEGRLDEAIAHLEAARDFYQPAGYRTETSNALILLGRAHRDKGDYDVAMKAFAEQLELAKKFGDPARVAAAHSSIGVLLGANQELYADALQHFADSYRINASVGARVGMGWDRANLAASLWPLGRYEEAKAALDEAAAIAAGPDAAFNAQLAYVDLVDAQMALSQGRRADASARATAALTRAEHDYKDTALQARQTLALASGSPRTALPLAEAAVTAARELKFPRLLSTALLALAEVRLAAGDGRGALADAQAAQRMFAASAQLESEWRAWLVAAASMRQQGEHAAAHDLAVRAESSRAALEARWGETSYRGYVRRPDIRIRLNQLGQLLGIKSGVSVAGGQ